MKQVTGRDTGSGRKDLLAPRNTTDGKVSSNTAQCTTASPTQIKPVQHRVPLFKRTSDGEATQMEEGRDARYQSDPGMAQPGLLTR